jgi:L-aminopeptidase/D-esterase-like protein
MTTTPAASRHNLITDIPGIRVGHTHDERVASGVTAVIIDADNVASGVTRGGAPGSRDMTLLEPEMRASGINAVVLSGGSLFGLDAAGGVVNALRDTGVGIRIGSINVPIAVQAITFDLLNGGDKAWGMKPPYWQLGAEAAQRAAGGRFALGSVGGGYGVTTATLKGGVGSASAVTPSGFTVGAIVVVNALGTATIGEGPHFWAAPYETAGEFGGLGLPQRFSDGDLALRMKGGVPPPPSTTIAFVACNAVLTKAEAKRIAIMADDGLARAVRPAHAPTDGDTVIAAATLDKPLRAGFAEAQITELGMAAGDCLARAIARAVYEAEPLPFKGALPSWKAKFGSMVRSAGGP